jgi:cytochrome c oxidase assembly factor CtaG
VTVPTFRERARTWLAPAAAAAALVFVVPPVASEARHDAAVQAIQFVIFAVVAPALLVLGWPRLSSWQRFAGSVARGRPEVRALTRLLPFMALVIVWRLPVVLAALSRDPALALAELVTLVVAGSALWLDLAGPAAGADVPSRPLRATMAAVAMWTIWVIAYITGMSGGSLFPVGGAAASAVDQRQIAAGVLWAGPAVSFVPVVYFMVITWLAEREDPDEELRAATAAGHGHPRPPRGWRSRAS